MTAPFGDAAYVDTREGCPYDGALQTFQHTTIYQATYKKGHFPLRGRWLIKFTIKNFNEFDETDEVSYGFG